MEAPESRSISEVVRAALPPDIKFIRVTLQQNSQSINVLGQLYPQHIAPLSAMVHIFFTRVVSEIELKQCKNEEAHLMELAFKDIPPMFIKHMTQHQVGMDSKSNNINISYHVTLYGDINGITKDLEEEAWNRYSKEFDGELTKTLEKKVE